MDRSRLWKREEGEEVKDTSDIGGPMCCFADAYDRDSTGFSHGEFFLN